MTAVNDHAHHQRRQEHKSAYTYQHGPTPDRRPGDSDQIQPLLGRLPVPMRDTGSRGRFAELWDQGVTWFWVILAVGICLGVPIIGTIVHWLS